MGCPFGDPGQAEDGHLPNTPVGLENPGGVPELVHSPADRLKVQDIEFAPLGLQGVQQYLAIQKLAKVPALEFRDLPDFLKNAFIGV